MKNCEICSNKYIQSPLCYILFVCNGDCTSNRHECSKSFNHLFLYKLLAVFFNYFSMRPHCIGPFLISYKNYSKQLRLHFAGTALLRFRGRYRSCINLPNNLCIGSHACVHTRSCSDSTYIADEKVIRCGVN